MLCPFATAQRFPVLSPCDMQVVYALEDVSTVVVCNLDSVANNRTGFIPLEEENVRPLVKAYPASQKKIEDFQACRVQLNELADILKSDENGEGQQAVGNRPANEAKQHSIPAALAN